MPSRSNTMIRYLMLFVSVQLALISSTSFAQDGFSIGLESGSPANSSQDLSSAFEIAEPAQVDFLPVEQAYQAVLSLTEDGLKIHWDIADGYYLYKERFGHQQLENQQLTAVATQLQAGKVIYDAVFEKDLEVYYHSTTATLQPKAGDSNNVKIAVDFQGCADAGLCYPPQTHWYDVNLNTQAITAIEAPGQNTPTTNDTSGGSTSNEAGSLLAAIILAFLGGMILNLMPCVFPVLSIKALSLAEAHQQAGEKHRHGWSYTVGVVASFVGIAAVMLILKAGGQAIGWGFQLQSPIFVSLLAYLFFAMALSLAGLAEFGTRLMGVGQQLTVQSGYRGSFFTGVLASLVASPCTAPFMGTALGYALGQPTAIALSIFAALGFGMALPFLLLSYIPSLGEKLPRPGPWMESFKQFLAFPLLLAAIWLLWVLGRQSGSDAIALALLGFMLIGFAFWLMKHGAVLAKLAAGASLVIALSLPALLSQLSQQSEGVKDDGFWQSYSQEKLDQALANGQPVFINATAAWCLTCLANERLAFGDAFEAQLRQQNTLALKADWTNYDANITDLLQTHGRSGVPLYLFYHQGGVKILPQLLTESLLLSQTYIKPSIARMSRDLEAR